MRRCSSETADLAAALREAAGGDGFDLVHDPLWGEPALAALSALRPFGRLVHVGQSAGAEATIPSSVVRATPVDMPRLHALHAPARSSRPPPSSAWRAMRSRASCASR